MRTRDPLLSRVLDLLGTGGTVEMALAVIGALPELVRSDPALHTHVSDQAIIAERDAALALAADLSASTNGDACLQLNAQITACLQEAQGIGVDHPMGSYAWTTAWDAVHALRAERDQIAADLAEQNTELLTAMAMDTPAPTGVPQSIDIGGTGEAAMACGVKAAELRAWARDASSGFPAPIGKAGNADLYDIGAVRAWHQARTT